jgi:capsular exopolysaccharide synthesis family protein
MDLVILSKPQSTAAEAYRTLRTNLHFASLESPLKTLVIASPDANEGVAVALANLAVAMAQGGKRIVAVDANLRAPSLHTIFNRNNANGISDALSKQDLQLQQTNVSGLSVLTSGVLPAVPTDAIGSNRMREVIETLKQQSDIVLFNAPPVTAFSDAALLSSVCDGVLLVVTANKTRRYAVQQAKDILTRAHANILGAVMLNV